MRFSIAPIQIAITLLAANAVYSQQETDIAFRTLGWDTNLSGVYYPREDGYREIVVRDGIFSGFYPYQGPGEMPIFRKTINEDTGIEEFNVIDRIALPSDSNQAILVFFKTKTAPKFKCIAYDDSLERVGSKDILITNFSPLALAFQIDDEERFGLKPGEVRVLNIGDNTHAQIQLAVYRTGEWKAEYQTRLRVRDGKRYLLFFRDAANRSPIGQGVEPIVLGESIETVRLAAKNPDASRETGHLTGEAYEYDPSLMEDFEMPDL